jgi:phage portal protein BeeE
MNLKQLIPSVGRNILKGDFAQAVKSFNISASTPINYSIEVNPSNYRGEHNGMFLFGNNGNDYLFRFTGQNDAVDAYQKCPPIAAIINRKGQSYINGKTWVLNTQGKESQTPDAKKLKKLIDKPNPLQSWKQFEAQGYIYQQLFGFNIVLPIKPYGFKENIDASQLWNIPPYMVDIEETNKLFYEQATKGVIEKIVLNYKGKRTNIDVDAIFIMKDIQPSFDYISIPGSRLQSLELPINNILGAYESRNVLINYRGALGILSHDPGAGQFSSLPLTDPDKEDLQKQFARYGLKGSQWKFIITSASLKWQSMSVPTKDLMLFEEVEADIMAICDQYNYPYQLMSTAKGTTYSNVKEGKQLLYQDGIIPEAQSNYEQWNQFFDTEKYNLKLDKDYSHIPALQQNELELTRARRERDTAYKIEWETGLITRNQWRIANGEDPVPGDDLFINQLQRDPDQPLAFAMTYGGVQGIIDILTSAMSEEAKKSTLEVVFGINPDDAARMVIPGEQQNQNINPVNNGNSTPAGQS